MSQTPSNEPPKDPSLTEADKSAQATDPSAVPELTPEEAKIQQQTEASLRKKRIIVFAIILLIILIGGGVGGYFFITKNSSKSSHGGDSSKLDSKEMGKKSIYIDLDDFIVNLNNVNSQLSFLKLSVSLETDEPKNEVMIRENMPKIRDSFQVYLRQMRPEDLKGSEGLFLLREELLLRINKILYPVTIKDILFNELIIQ